MKMIVAAMTSLLVAALLVSNRGVEAQNPAPGPQPRVEPPAKTQASDRPEDRKAIKAITDAFIGAFNKGDAKAIAALFVEDAELTDETEAKIQGRNEIADHFQGVFEDLPGATLTVAVESLRFLGPDVARETGHARITPGSGGGSPDSSHYTAIYVRRDGRWLHDSIDESPDTQLTAHDRLLELEWMLGEWVDESAEGVVHTTCQWSADKNYLLRDFTLRISGQPVMSGTQRIGWDPSTLRFKTWVFDADGAFNEGHWERADKNQWLVKTHGVLADGRVASSTQIVTFMNKNMMRWRSTDRAVGGVVISDTPEFVLVRTPPKPTGPASTPNSNTQPQRKP